MTSVSGPEGPVDVAVSFYPQETSDFAWVLQVRERKRVLRRPFTSRASERVTGPVTEAIGRIVTAKPEVFRNAG